MLMRGVNVSPVALTLQVWVQARLAQIDLLQLIATCRHEARIPRVIGVAQPKCISKRLPFEHQIRVLNLVNRPASEYTCTVKDFVATLRIVITIVTIKVEIRTHRCKHLAKMRTAVRAVHTTPAVYRLIDLCARVAFAVLKQCQAYLIRQIVRRFDQVPHDLFRQVITIFRPGNQIFQRSNLFLREGLHHRAILSMCDLFSNH